MKLTPAHGVKCPKCGARPGVRCRNRDRLKTQASTHKKNVRVHKDRLEAWKRTISVYKRPDGHSKDGGEG